MSTHAWRKVIAAYQTGAGLGGVWLIVQSGALELRGVTIVRVVVLAVLLGFCGLLMASGILVGRNHRLGPRLTRLAQWIQVPQVTSHLFSFVLFAPASLVISGTSAGDLGMYFNLASTLRLTMGRTYPTTIISINVLPLMVIYLLRTRLSAEVSTHAVVRDAA